MSRNKREGRYSGCYQSHHTRGEPNDYPDFPQVCWARWFYLKRTYGRLMKQVKKEYQ